LDLAQLLLEIEVLVFLGRGDADVAAGSEAPVGDLDVLAVDKLDESRHGLQLRLRKPVSQPRHLPVEIQRVLQLLDGGLALFVELLHQPARGAVVEGVGRHSGHGLPGIQKHGRIRPLPSLATGFRLPRRNDGDVSG
jgi:hypothetical protein